MPPNARKARWDLLEIDLQGHRNGNGLWAAGRIPLELRPQRASGGLLTGVWLTAGFGVVLKLVLPGRFDRVAVVLYLLLGWSGVRFRHCLASKLNSLASRGRRCAVFDRCHLSSLAEPAFSERDLAYLRASRRGLSLHSGPWIRGTCTGMRQLANVRFG